MYYDRVIFIAVFQQAYLMSKLLVLQFQALNVELRLALIRGFQKNEPRQLLPSAVFVSRKNLYAELT